MTQERCVFLTEETDRKGSWSTKRWFCQVAGNNMNCQFATSAKKECKTGAFTEENGQTGEQILELISQSSYHRKILETHRVGPITPLHLLKNIIRRIILEK